MTVTRVGQQDNTSSRLSTIVKSTAAGTVAGYATKWIWPVMKQEDTIDKKAMFNYCRKVTNRAKAKEFAALADKSLAQDSFIEMANKGYTNIVKDDGRKLKKSLFTADEIAKRVDALGGENSVAGKELKGIIRGVNEQSKQMMRRFSTSYGIMLKKIRQPIPFLVAGAGVGFFTGFTHNVMKTDYYA